jgi:AraC-like DNA-binding protein
MLLYSALLTFFLSFIFIVFNFKENKGRLFLALFLNSLASLGLLHDLISFDDGSYWFTICCNLLSTLYLLPGPLLFLYAKKSYTAGKSSGNWKDLLHFIPAMLNLVVIFFYNLSSAKQHQLFSTSLIESFNKPFGMSWPAPTLMTFVFGLLLILIYGLTVFIKWINYKPRETDFNNQSKINSSVFHQKWMLTLSAVTCTLPIFFVALFCIKHDIFFSTENLRSVNFTVAPLLSTIPILLLLFPSILYGKPIALEKETPAVETPEQTKLKRLSSFSEEQLISLSMEILNYLEREKPFVNSEFSMSHLAVAFNVPQQHIASCFNHVLKKKFTSLRTEFRVNYAKELLANGLSNTLSIDGIGTQAGFTTRSHFYASFKAVVGCSPLAYLEQQSLQLQPA